MSAPHSGHVDVTIAPPHYIHISTFVLISLSFTYIGNYKHVTVWTVVEMSRMCCRYICDEPVFSKDSPTLSTHRIPTGML